MRSPLTKLVLGPKQKGVASAGFLSFQRQFQAGIIAFSGFLSRDLTGTDGPQHL